MRDSVAKFNANNEVHIIKAQLKMSTNGILKIRKFSLKHYIPKNSDYETVKRRLKEQKSYYNTEDGLAALKAKSTLHRIYAWCIEYENEMAAEVCCFFFPDYDPEMFL